jgi:hypothetical protein
MELKEDIVRIPSLLKALPSTDSKCPPQSRLCHPSSFLHGCGLQYNEENSRSPHKMM